TLYTGAFLINNPTTVKARAYLGANSSAVASMSYVQGPTASILNPYYNAPTWKLWREDPSPVTHLNVTYAPPDFATRIYPDFSAPVQFPWPFLITRTFSSAPAAAGFWDDFYWNMDGAHSSIHTSWSDQFGNSIATGGQFMRELNSWAFPPATL